MINLTHNQLELLSKFVNTIEAPPGYPQNSQFSSLKNSLDSKVVRSKMVFAITLRYPVTQIEEDVIHWIIKNSLPTNEQLAEFHKLQGNV